MESKALLRENALSFKEPHTSCRKRWETIAQSAVVMRDDHTGLSAENVRVHPKAAQLVHIWENSHCRDAMACLQHFTLPTCDPGRSFVVDGSKQLRSQQTFKFSGMYHRGGGGRLGLFEKRTVVPSNLPVSGLTKQSDGEHWRLSHIILFVLLKLKLKCDCRVNLLVLQSFGAGEIKLIFDEPGWN